MEHKAKVVEMLSEAYMGTSTLKRGDLEAREDEVWPVIGRLLLPMSKWSNVKFAGVKRPGGHDGGFHVQLGDKSNGQTAQWVFSISASFHSIS